MGLLFGKVERRLYKALQTGEKINDLKRHYQLVWGINARQFNSIHTSIKGKIASRAKCHKRQLSQLADQIKGLEKSIKKLVRQLKTIPIGCGLGKRKSPRGLQRWELHQKQRRLRMLTDRLTELKTKKPSIIFGGRRLWKAQFELEANGYGSHDEWLSDWKAARSSQFLLVGSSDETAGCLNCQLTRDGAIKIRVPAALESRFGKYISASGVHFAYGQKDIEYALNKGQSLTYRFVRKHGIWYIFCTIDLATAPTQSRWYNGMLGVDLNPSVIGWSYCDQQGNLKTRGQIRLNLRDRSSEQVKATLGDAVKQLVDIAAQYRCPITVERLDFSQKKASMRESGVRYSRMLSNFAYSQFGRMLDSRAHRWGIEVVKVNPAYSSLIGCIKFMHQYGLSSDTAAGLVLARRSLRKSERIPARIALYLQVDRHKHIWSFWNALGKKLCSVRRHSYYQFREPNRLVEVIQQREFGKPDRRSRKLKGTSTGGMGCPPSNPRQHCSHEVS